MKITISGSKAMGQLEQMLINAAMRMRHGPPGPVGPTGVTGYPGMSDGDATRLFEEIQALRTDIQTRWPVDGDVPPKPWAEGHPEAEEGKFGGETS